MNALIPLIARTCKSRKAFFAYASVLILILIGAIGFLAQRSQEIEYRRTGIRVQVTPLQLANQTLSVTGYGTVEPSKVLEIRPQVYGHVVSIHTQLQEGGRINEGELLVQIDPRDYQIEIETKKAGVARAEYELKLEQSNQVIAKHEWNLLNDDRAKATGDRDLALRIPNIKEKESALRAMQSQLEKAKLDLERCSIRAPFNALILSESVEVGGYIDPAANIVKLAATDSFNIKVQIPEQQISWLSYDGTTGEVTSTNIAKITAQLQNASSNVRFGKIERLLGNVEAGGHMAQLMVAVPYPLSSDESVGPLLLGSYVKVEIIGKQLEDVYRLPRTSIRERGRVLVADGKNRLRARVPHIVYENENIALARGGFEQSDRLITTNIQGSLEGTPLITQEYKSGL